MKRSDFHFDLPSQLIAQHPVEPRTASRLLEVDSATGALTDRRFADLADLLEPGDLLIANNTRVIPARLIGRKETGGRAEIMVERLRGDREALVQIRCSKKPKPGSTIEVGAHRLVVDARDGEFWWVRTAEGSFFDILNAEGHMPLPPYIEREDTAADRERYQTVYAAQAGAVAAPTAGLHFDQPLLERLAVRGVRWAEVTLHVGAGTFQPVRVDDIREHQMHAEWLEVSAEVCALHAATRRAGRRVVAVGTTTLRALESAVDNDGVVHPFAGDSDIFIYPGKAVRSVDVLITNFHLPESTLLMLVSAFAGTENIRRAYAHAIACEYRFFSYGDACWLSRDPAMNLDEI